jgi:hypothetical protein
MEPRIWIDSGRGFLQNLDRELLIKISCQKEHKFMRSYTTKHLTPNNRYWQLKMILAFNCSQKILSNYFLKDKTISSHKRMIRLNKGKLHKN